MTTVQLPLVWMQPLLQVIGLMLLMVFTILILKSITPKLQVASDLILDLVTRRRGVRP